MHILIVDDESVIRTGAKRTLEQARPEATIHLAASADEALRVLSGHPVAIVLTDILMPGIDGLELMRITRRKYPHIRWVVISAYSEFSYAQRAVQLGAKDYLLKPIGKKRLIELVGELEIELKREQAAVKESELLRTNAQYVREGMFQRLVAGQDIGSVDLALLSERYPEFYLIMVRLEAAGKDASLEHFITDNVLSELLERYGDGFVVSYDRLTLVGLAELATEDSLLQLVASMRGYLGSYLKIPFQIAYSNSLRELRSVREATNKLVRQAAGPHTERVESIRMKGGGDNKAIEGALQYIHAHYKEETLSLEKIAAVVFLNPVYFSQLFKQKTGQGFKDYLIGLRLEEARQLLRDSDLKLADIAVRVGYHDMRHFTQVFRKRFLLTPTEYRNQQKDKVTPKHSDS